MPSLESLLHTTFGHRAFRANQEAVCRAATEGQDCLLVMPTGAGKSLCYQLPVLARGGTGLVISPLIALMDDQANKLAAAGLRVARIHSGMSREQSRQACRDYLDGNLQFLFIAPERLRVPGFPEMLARRKPSLVAIDEAHCISAWGHDFRPDYRTLGDHLPALRPAPIIALTATATPTVQRDIVTALNLSQPALFIHGFRRDNLHIEVLELSKPRRTEFVTQFLADKTRRPAIIYAPSRKAAEELAGDLNRTLKKSGAPEPALSSSKGLASETWASAYHAGLDTTTRERVQNDFLSGKLEVVVATIAFGMGIDKADVRTVIHYALPASVEAYYQEIGRAGRDGEPSRTVLLYSYADRKMHDFFLERDYPVAAELTKVARLLTDEYQMPAVLQQRARLDYETFSRAVEKLASQGAALIDFDNQVKRGATTTWQSGYELQVNFRRSQIDRMMDFAQTQQCRMTALIKHFGDTADSTKPCGHCDFCAPSAVTSQALLAPTDTQQRHLRQILLTLRNTSKSTGQLHTALNLPDRKQTDDLLDGLARAGYLTLATDTFTKPDGTTISYKKASLTAEGQAVDDSAPIEILLRTFTPDPNSKKKRVPQVSTLRPGSGTAPPLTESQRSLEANLKAWRKAKAAETGKPAFIIFGDAALAALVQQQPQTISELLQVSGFGPDKSDKYGAEITALCRADNSRVPRVSTLRPGSEPAKTTTRGKNRRVPHPSQPHREGWGIEQSSTPAPPAHDDNDPFPDYDSIAPEPGDFDPGAYDLPDQLPYEPAPVVHPPAPRTRVQIAQRYTLAPEPILTDELPAQRPPAKSQKPLSAASSTPTDPNHTALETRLRLWRKSESERLGLPQFFILGTTTLRSIVTAPPSTLEELATIPGIDPEKLKKYGQSILEACTQ